MNDDYKSNVILLFLEGCCCGNQLMLESNECQLIPPAFFALAFQNELQYHCLNACINSGCDGTQSSNYRDDRAHLCTYEPVLGEN